MNILVKFSSIIVGIHLFLSPCTHANVIFDDDKLDIVARNFYFFRDYQNGSYNPSGANSQLPISQKNTFRNEWAQGFVGQYSSGYTDTALQLGFNLYGRVGIKLYSDVNSTGTLILQYDPVTGKTKSYFGDVGGAIKLKFKDTVLTYGDQFPNVPVMSTSTVRLLPPVSTGLTIENKSIKNLDINFGYFYSVIPLDSTTKYNYFTTDYGIKAESMTYLGATYKFPNGSLTTYFAQMEDLWNQVFINGKYQKKLNNDDQKIYMAFSGFNNSDTGKKVGGSINSNIASAMFGYKYKNQDVAIAYQQVFGKDPFDWLSFYSCSGNSPNLNTAQYATFTEAREKSVQFKYEIDMEPYGIPGLSFMGRYFYGWNIDNSQSHNYYYTKRYIYNPNIDYTHWERDIEVRYKIPSGFAKGLDIKLRQASHRGTKGYRYDDIDELRVIMEYKFSF